MGLNHERSHPTHSLDEARRLAHEGKLTVNRRARDFIRNRHGRNDTGCFVTGLFDAIDPQDFYKSVELDVMPGCWGDVYRGVEYEGEEWYVKFTVREDGTASLCVLSANWEGYLH